MCRANVMLTTKIKINVKAMRARGVKIKEKRMAYWH